MRQAGGAILVAGLADRLLGPGESYDDLIGREIALTLRLPRGESAGLPDDDHRRARQLRPALA